MCVCPRLNSPFHPALSAAGKEHYCSFLPVPNEVGCSFFESHLFGFQLSLFLLLVVFHIYFYGRTSLAPEKELRIEVFWQNPSSTSFPSLLDLVYFLGWPT